MRRFLHHTAAALSLIVLLLAAGMWARSTRIVDSVRWQSASGQRWEVDSFSGVVALAQTGSSPYAVSGTVPASYSAGFAPSRWNWRVGWAPAPGDVVWNFLAVAIVSRGIPDYPIVNYVPMGGLPPAATHSQLGVILPYWTILLLAALLPLRWLRRHSRTRRQHRLRAGLCLRCGYNLTGNASGVCPECGMARGLVKNGLPSSCRSV